MAFTRKLQVEEVDNGFIVTTFKDGRLATSCVASTDMKVDSLATEWARGKAPVVEAVTEPTPIEKMLLTRLHELARFATGGQMQNMAKEAITEAKQMRGE